MGDQVLGRLVKSSAGTAYRAMRNQNEKYFSYHDGFNDVDSISNTVSCYRWNRLEENECRRIGRQDKCVALLLARKRYTPICALKNGGYQFDH